ncbi:PREDICTED: protein ACCELERATED CELL DEATH 6-like [Ipomoea nil]|uniref:protein ACCELERATED CELL DEATH 6-like n=1 Tax=Ipomoea nil TaxID=35883 RepID=UPI0009019EF3|nr:PREDICTED: protein ACCELERATED CELL DEATH 6-like [Ipomoea nil]
MSDPKYPRLSEEESYDMENTMDPELYTAITKGDLLEFIRAMEERITYSHHGSTADCVHLAPQKNTVLHLATIHGHDEIVKLICKDLPFFIAEKNVKGDIPLHIAARTGSSLLVELLIGADYREGCLGETNREGNTALHEALRHNHKDVAQMLIFKHPNMSYGVNKEGKSLLYLAAEAGFESIVKLLMENPVGRYAIAENNKHKSPIHAAIIGRNIDVLKLLWEYDKSSFQTRCEKGWNPLHYAADNGYLDGVDFLLNRCHEFGYHRDKQGVFPVHIASIRGHCNIVSMMLQRRPDSIELLTLQGQNILHVAAKGRRLKAFDYMLKMPEMERLINQRDEDGNTALHVATIYGNPKVVSSLMWDERVRVGLENSNGLTALDIAEDHMRTDIESFQKRLTWMALRVGGAPRAPNSKVLNGNGNGRFMVRQHPRMEDYRDRVNVILLVATLVVTVTFTAGFTIPGGSNNSSPNQGIATMLEKVKFQEFIICDSIAMYSAIIVAVTMIWAQLGDISSMQVAFRLALPLLWISLAMMSAAFMAGVYLVVSKIGWLANVVLFMGSNFIFLLTLLFLPLCFLGPSNHRSFRSLSYYPFCLVLFALGSYAEEEEEAMFG